MIIISNSSSKITRLNYWKTKKYIKAKKESEDFKIPKEAPKIETSNNYVLGPKQKLMKKYESIPTQERLYGYQQYIRNMKVYAIKHPKYQNKFY